MSEPVAIEVRDLHKGFRLRRNGADTLKERLLEARNPEGERLEVLRGLDFDIRQGEFFGVTGRNGSGKSTLLQLLAGIYRADAGTIRVAGSVAPFIQLGVGFHPELDARDNVVLNAVMMGLDRATAEKRVDDVIEFAGLHDFAAMKLRNYSSGMRVRLGFSVLVHSDARILLLDEVLAVGDAAFQRQCEQAFSDLSAEGRTIVLVSHSMSRVRRFCDRALLLEDGRIAAMGAPDQVAARYEETVPARAAAGPGGPA